jgi:hypothetical protein
VARNSERAEADAKRKLSKDRGDRALFGAAITFTVAAALSLAPNPLSLSWNMFGYRSLCSFVPLSTIACALAALLSGTLRSRYFMRGGAKKRSPAKPIAAAIVLVALALAAWPYWLASRNDSSTRMQSDIPDSELGYTATVPPEDPDFPTVTTLPPARSGEVEWID